MQQLNSVLERIFTLKGLINYRTKRVLKIIISISALLLVVGFLFYTQNLAERLAEEEKRKLYILADAYKQLLRGTETNDPPGDVSFMLEIVQNNSGIPLILYDSVHDEILNHRNLDTSRNDMQDYLRRQLTEMKAAHPPISVESPGSFKHFLYYKHSDLVTQLTYFPVILLTVLGAFLLFTYRAFSASRKYEQNRVWVGMARETAHQLGTPLSALMAWLEFLKESDDKPDPQILKEMERDINRLLTVTERFSKIGAVPVPEHIKVIDAVDKALRYLDNRISKKVTLQLDPDSDRYVYTAMSVPLFEWVMENLVKNAVNAISGAGRITVRVERSVNYVNIDVTDTGKGIPKKHFKTVFSPGFTTRKRGWGLGLSLSKRIIEEYHGGQIFVKRSKPGEGTTFRIRMPLTGTEPHPADPALTNGVPTAELA